MNVRHCPDCGAEYASTTTQCVDHDVAVDLVEGPPPDTSGAPQPADADLDELVTAEVRLEVVVSQLRTFGWVLYVVGLLGCSGWLYQSWRTIDRFTDDDLFGVNNGDFPNRLDVLVGNVTSLVFAALAIGLGVAMRAGAAWLDVERRRPPEFVA